MRGAPFRARFSTAAAFITMLYIAGTLCVLLAMPKEQVSGLQGIMQAMQAMAGEGRRRRGSCRSSPRSSR